MAEYTTTRNAAKPGQLSPGVAICCAPKIRASVQWRRANNVVGVVLAAVNVVRHGHCAARVQPRGRHKVHDDAVKQML